MIFGSDRKKWWNSDIQWEKKKLKAEDLFKYIWPIIKQQQSSKGCKSLFMKDFKLKIIILFVSPIKYQFCPNVETRQLICYDWFNWLVSIGAQHWHLMS